jgi:IclR family pca regulon transcriptional regulator
MTPAYQVEALARGLRILALFSDRRTSLMLKEMAELTGLPLPTVFRLVATLEAAGCVERSDDGSYRPGLAVLTLGFAALRGDDVLEAADRRLRRLAAETGETVNLGSLRGAQVLYLVRIRNDANLVTANLQVGSTLPAIHSSLGKLLLAHLSPDELAALEPEFAFDNDAGPNAVRSATALRRQLDEIRADGHAVQDEEVAHGLRSIAAPVRADDGRVAYAVNIAVPASQRTVDELVAELLPPLTAACEELSLRLGAPAADVPSPPPTTQRNHDR